MAAQIPIKNDPEAHKAAMTKVLADKLREVTAGTFFLLIFALLKFVGHDGTWVAHPGLIADVLAMWNEHMPGPNQIASKKRADVVVSERVRPCSTPRCPCSPGRNCLTFRATPLLKPVYGLTAMWR